MSVEIIYNDNDFDRQNYPLKPWHLDAIASITKQFNLPPDTKWYYHATIHSRCFWFHYEPRREHMFRRLGVDNMRFLVNLPGFRWIAAEREYAVGISLAHTIEQEATTLRPVDWLAGLQTVADCDEWIAKKQAQLRECVGWLYPSILRDEIAMIETKKRAIAEKETK